MLYTNPSSNLILFTSPHIVRPNRLVRLRHFARQNEMYKYTVTTDSRSSSIVFNRTHPLKNGLTFSLFCGVRFYLYFFLR